MKDINAVLSQKLEELKRCRIDLYCLKGTIRLLTETVDAQFVLGQCETPHHLVHLSPDGKSLIQDDHVQEAICKNWSEKKASALSPAEEENVL